MGTTHTFVKQIIFHLVFPFIALNYLSGQAAQMHLIAVGLDKYDQDLPVLDKCGKDARDLSAQLQKNVGLYTPGVHTVLENAGATKSAVLNAIESLKGKNPNDVVVFYFAGYGTDHAIFPFDARLSALDNNNIISVATLKEKLESLGCRYLLFINNNKSTVYVASEATPSTAITTDGILSVISKKEALSVRYLNPTSEIFACNGCANSFLMQALLAAIENQEISEQSSFSYFRADEDGNKIVSLAELAAFIPKCVRALRSNATQSFGGIQAPEPKMYLNKNVSLDLFTTNPGQAPFTKDQDSDGDGLTDRLDQCPQDWAKTASGCPDADEDGIPDKDDRCKYEKGDAANKGCPDLSKKDQDNDGVPDKADKCPDVRGLARFQGCPDTDNDGIPDYDDRCPSQKGAADNNGCPAGNTGVATLTPKPRTTSGSPDWYQDTDGKFTTRPAFFAGLSGGHGGIGPIIGGVNLLGPIGLYGSFRVADPEYGDQALSGGALIKIFRTKQSSIHWLIGLYQNFYDDSVFSYYPGFETGISFEIKRFYLQLGITSATYVGNYTYTYSSEENETFPFVQIGWVFRKKY